MTAEDDRVQRAIEKAIEEVDKRTQLIRDDGDRRWDELEAQLDRRFADIWREFHEHLLQVREETKVAFISSEKAITKAETSMEKRLDGMNEFRDQLRDQAATLMPRTESIQRHNATNEKIDALEHRLADRIAALGDESRKAVDAVESRIDKRDGTEAGKQANTSKLIAFIGAAAALLTIIITLVVLVANGKFGG